MLLENFSRKKSLTRFAPSLVEEENFFLNLQSCNREGSSVRDSQEGEGEGKVWYNGSA